MVFYYRGVTHYAFLWSVRGVFEMLIVCVGVDQLLFPGLNWMCG